MPSTNSPRLASRTRLDVVRLEDRCTPAQLSTLAVGADAGGGPNVKVFNRDGTLRANFLAFDAGFVGGVRVAQGDVNGDGTTDIIVGAGPGGAPHVKVFDGKNPANVLASFFAFDGSFRGGVSVAAGDVNGDGKADIIVGAGPGGGANVRVFSGAASGVVLANFLAYPSFGGGVNVAAGLVNADAKVDIITAPMGQGGPNVRVFDVGSLTLLRDFMAYDPSYNGGVFVAAGDVDGDGQAEVITGAARDSSHVKTFSGATGNLLASFQPYGTNFPGGVRVAAMDWDNDGKADVVTGPGPSGGPNVKVFGGVGAGTLLTSFMAFDPNFLGGVFVG